MNENPSANLPVAADERLNTLSEIAQDCLGVDTFSACTERPDARCVVDPESIIRALESAYDIGLIAGYRLSQANRARR